MVGIIRVGSTTTWFIHRRFTEWVEADVFGPLHRLLLDILGATGQIDWSRAAVDSISVRAVRGT